MLPRITPIAPTKIAAPFAHDDFVFELKHDGFRAAAYIEDGKCQLVSRKDITYKSFPGLCTALAGLRVKRAILGDKFGRSQRPEKFKRGNCHLAH